ncbi:MAG: hypothetical protein QXL34_06720 [Thermosphaera sp.]
MYNYCTLFDSNYLTRGLAMYESLRKHSRDHNLFILAFDDKCERILKQLNLEKVTLISLRDFEDEELQMIKIARSRKEYCWTCTPSLIKYCIEKYNLDMCTYLDADIYFYEDPQILLKEMGNNIVMISPHRYTFFYDQSNTSGIYCVQFVTFKNDKDGMTVLEWWRQACNSWCYSSYKGGKFGDQKYLDDWPIRFKGVHVMKHLGAGVAPWNIQQYELAKVNEKGIFLRWKRTKEEFPLIFYHYHNIKFMSNNMVDFGDYIIPSSIRKVLYEGYIRNLLLLTDNIKKVEDGDYNYTIMPENDWEKLFLSFLSRVNLLQTFFFYFFNSFLKVNLQNLSKRRPFLAKFINVLTRPYNKWPVRYFRG